MGLARVAHCTQGAEAISEALAEELGDVTAYPEIKEYEDIPSMVTDRETVNHIKEVLKRFKGGFL